MRFQSPTNRRSSSCSISISENTTSITLPNKSFGNCSTTLNDLAFKSNAFTCSQRTTPVVTVLLSSGICNGTGVQKILESYTDCDIEPEFMPAPASFVVALPNRNTRKRTVDDLDLSREERVLRLLSERGSISRKDVEQLLGCSSFPVNRVLKTLLERQQIIQTGAARGTRYVLRTRF